MVINSLLGISGCNCLTVAILAACAAEIKSLFKSPNFLAILWHFQNGAQMVSKTKNRGPDLTLEKMTLAVLDILNMLLIISSITDLESEKVERGEGEAASNILGGFASFASNILVA